MQPPIEKSVPDQAAEWLALLTDESCDPRQHRSFARWLMRSNTHIEEFLRLSALVRVLQGRSMWPDVDTNALIDGARTDSKVIEVGAPGNSATRPRTFGRFSRAALAAVAILVVGVAAVVATRIPAWLEGRHTYSSGLGELRSVVLEDGSIIQLNAQSRVHARYTTAERRVELTAGEAVFKVAKDTTRPFRVLADYTEVVAVGTQFNVRSQTDATIVTVIEGRVAISAPASDAAALAPIAGQPSEDALLRTSGAGIMLVAGEQAVMKPKHSIAKATGIDPAKVTGWTQRRLYFDDTPLFAVADEFARNSPKVIRIDDVGLRGRRISGTFDSSDPGALVRFLERYGDTSVTKTEHGWVLAPRAPR